MVFLNVVINVVVDVVIVVVAALFVVPDQNIFSIRVVKLLENTL